MEGAGVESGGMDDRVKSGEGPGWAMTTYHHPPKSRLYHTTTPPPHTGTIVYASHISKPYQRRQVIGIRDAEQMRPCLLLRRVVLEYGITGGIINYWVY